MLSPFSLSTLMSPLTNLLYFHFFDFLGHQNFYCHYLNITAINSATLICTKRFNGEGYVQQKLTSSIFIINFTTVLQ